MIDRKNNRRGSRLIKNTAGTLAIPAVFAAVLLTLCGANGKSMITNMTGFDNFVVYTAIVMVTTMALSINLNSGRFDFSLGSMAALSSLLSAKLTYAVFAGGTGSAITMLVFCVIIGAVLGVFCGVLYVLLRIPPIITSLGVTLIFEGVTFAITEGRYIMAEVQNPSMQTFIGAWYYPAIIIVVVLAIMIYVFDHTRFGYNYRALKEGQKVAVNTGVREVPNAIACYMISGALMGIVGFLNTSRNMNIDGSVLNFGSISIMFTAFLPMFIGGYIGRFSSDKLGYLLAAICMSMLNSTFAAFSNEITASMQSIINALILLVFLIYLNNQGLPAKIFSRKKKAEEAV